MILQLQPDQISAQWEMIKYAAIDAMELNPPANEYTQALFSSLLSGTHQCWLIFDDERNPHAMGITCIAQDKLTGVTQLHIEVFYSYQTLSEELAREATQHVKQFALACNCKQIRTLTANTRAMRLLSVAGFYTGKTEYLLNCD